MKNLNHLRRFFIPLLFGLLFLSGSCARLGMLNLQEHQYGILPTRIVWIQVAGLQDEHLALLRFFRPTVSEVTSFENIGCVGKVWTYNLFQLRPSPALGLLSQLTGKKNIKNNCTDYSFTPVWTYMLENGYQAGVFESLPSAEYGLDQALLCEQGEEFLRGPILWEMRPRPPHEKFPVRETEGKGGPAPEKIKEEKAPESVASSDSAPPSRSQMEKGRREREREEWKTRVKEVPVNEKKGKEKFDFFHVQDLPLFQGGQIYYDRSCQKDGCFTSLARNIDYVFESFQKNRSQYFFMVRDFTLYRALRDHDMDRVKEILLELEKIYRYFLSYQQNDRNMLILLTSSAPLNFEFPDEGKDWATFEEKGRPVLYKRPSLLAPVFAKGARAENFCGIYEEAQILQRMTTGPPRVGF